MATQITSKIRIAVVGGGIAGATMANALLRQPDIDVHIYEAASEFSERGAGVVLGSHTIAALADIVPNAHECILKEAGAVLMNSSRLMMGSGSYAGAIIQDIGGTDKEYVVHRAALLKTLLAPLPAAVQHSSKKLLSITEEAGNVELTFEDGTHETFQAVIGADGIFGSVRKHVLQDQAQDHDATPAGFWDCRHLVPFERAKNALGAQYFEKPRQYGWCGDGAFILHDVLDNGNSVQCIVSVVEPVSPKERSRPLTREILANALHNWLDGPIAKNMIEIILESENVKMYSQLEHKSTPTYANGHVCIIGDAAHATSPWQGSGAALALEDAAVLSALLADVQSKADISAAFKAFDEARRPRGQDVIDSSRMTGNLICFQREATNATPQKLQELLGRRWEFILDFDLQKQKEEAIKGAIELRKSSNRADS